MPRFVIYSSPPTGDQAHYLMVLMSILQDGDLDLYNNYSLRDEDKFYSLAPHPPNFVGIEAPYPLPPHRAFSKARPDSEWYNFHFPGLSVMLIPAWVVGGWFSLWWPATVAFMCLLGALLMLNVFMLAYEMTGKLWIAWAVWLPLAFSNPIMSYSYMIFTELPTGLLTIYAFRRLALGWAANGPWRRTLIGLCLAYIPWLAWRCVTIAAPLGVYAAVQWARGSKVRHLLSTLPMILPVVISAGLLLWHNYYLFGSMAPPAKVPEQGDADPFMLPWKGPTEFTRFVFNALAHLFDRQMGLLINTPIFVLAVVGIIAMVRSGRLADRRLLLVLAAVSFPFFFLVTIFVYWNGLWNPPARFLTTLVALTAAPLAMSLFALRRNWVYTILYAALAIPGIFIMAIRMYDARLFWPANSMWQWLVGAPESPIRIDLYNRLPIFSPLDELRLPLNSARVLAIAVGIVLLSYLLMEFRRRTADGLRTTAVWVVALGAVWGSWYVANAEYLKPTTLLTEVARWELGPAPVQPMGIAYLDGDIYVADYAGQSVFKLDTDAFTYEPFLPVGSEGGQPKDQITYYHPADVEVGPDGLLYVLNNDPSGNALLVMRPDGTVVRTSDLPGKTPVASGIAFGPDGALYVADISGGRILKYEMKSGTPVPSGTFVGERGGFNNLMGVGVAPDGKIYAAEISELRVQELDSLGNFVRDFKLPCSPNYVVVSGSWAEATCGAKVVSLNLKTGETQRGHTADNANPLNAPTGLTYGPDGTLHVIDGALVLAYELEH